MNLDDAFDLRDEIAEAVSDLVDKMTENVPKDVDEFVRQILTEQYRFWRRVK